MLEPTSSAGQQAASALIVTIAGVSTGLPADLILPSFAGALYSLRSGDEGDPWWRLVQVLVGTLFAAWSTQPMSMAVGQIAPIVAPIPAEVLRFSLAFLLGWGGLTLLLKRVETWVQVPKK